MSVESSNQSWKSILSSAVLGMVGFILTWFFFHILLISLFAAFVGGICGALVFKALSGQQVNGANNSGVTTRSSSGNIALDEFRKLAQSLLELNIKVRVKGLKGELLAVTESTIDTILDLLPKLYGEASVTGYQSHIIFLMQVADDFPRIVEGQLSVSPMVSPATALSSLNEFKSRVEFYVTPVEWNASFAEDDVVAGIRERLVEVRTLENPLPGAQSNNHKSLRKGSFFAIGGLTYKVTESGIWNPAEPTRCTEYEALCLETGDTIYLGFWADTALHCEISDTELTPGDFGLNVDRLLRAASNGEDLETNEAEYSYDFEEIAVYKDSNGKSQNVRNYIYVAEDHGISIQQWSGSEVAIWAFHEISPAKISVLAVS